MEPEHEDEHADEQAAPALPQLDEVEQRVIGSLLEKEVTVPATYPLTLNALRTACNQSSSREPVTDLSDVEITDAIDRLKARGLARMVHASSGARSLKYRQVLDEALQLEPDERALLTVLLLRGPQAPGELKARTERLHPFGDRAEVEAALASMAVRSRGALVRELERQPGQHDARWVHLLGPVAVVATSSGRSSPVPAIDRDVVLTDGAAARDAGVVAAYDAAATGYADALLDELDAKPFDRWLLERLAALAGDGPVADVGCGPGQVAAALAMAGADARGFDLAPGMVVEARLRFPELAFDVADLTDLPAPGDGPDLWAAIAAWYSLVHLAGSELAPALHLLATRLAPGGWLALAVHVGHEVVHRSELFGAAVELDFVLHDPDQVLAAVDAAGFVEVEWYRRGPIVDVEAPTERLYVLARRPSDGSDG